MVKNYYDILEVAPGVSKEEIKISFRKLVRKFHPDVNKSPEAEAIFKKINEAIEILGDDLKRLKYDHSMNFETKSYAEEKKSNVKADFKRADEKNEKHSETTQKEGPKRQTGKNFSEIFHQFFDEKNHEPKIKKIDGENIYMNLEITSKEAASGVIKKVNIMHSEQCPKCGGRKFINGARCTLCDGVGEKTNHKKVTITIPKNPKNGSVVRVAGEGKLGKFGGKNGDLLISVIVKHSDIFKIENGIAILELPLTPPEALLGSDVKIPTMSGFTIMKIPPQTNSGQKFRILNAGVLNQKTGTRGDLIVIAKIFVPQTPTIEEIRLYKELKNLDKADIRRDLFE